MTLLIVAMGGFKGHMVPRREDRTCLCQPRGRPVLRPEQWDRPAIADSTPRARAAPTLASSCAGRYDTFGRGIQGRSPAVAIRRFPQPCGCGKGISMQLEQHIRFLRRYLRSPSQVGAIGPSSRALAVALCEPYRRFSGPAKVLEVGAGTGAVTRHLGSLLGAEDELDICEIDPDFADVLRHDVLTQDDFAPAVAAGRVRLLQLPVQELPYENRYDFIISGLPLTAFRLRDLQNVFGVMRRCLRPGGMLSYFEYMALRKTSRLLSIGPRRARIRSVSAYLSRNIREHQIDRRTVFQNLPPAYARHFQFST